ncbi:hypothetical protein CYLTODRAFT_449535 [Cylindrobasidium torrendii FP15055 ss-10]|uniref:ferric-chelate reductase (NADPH) n=1 Tax=Cylindrobasidium torrendii FP15055 ss-10 TaxID=1314674 RepID=A0A0D7BRK8_9AGAR|nr:hypothetical protein CYLTODRAFT_449535 [Cylindrobasidium torrendii FP15055 ss-10]
MVHLHSGNASDYTDAELADMARDPYELTPRYARGVVYFICIVIAGFAILRGILAARASKRFASLTQSNGYRKATSAARYLSSKQHQALGYRFPTLGVGLLLLAFFAFIMLWTFVTQPYYRARWNVGSPPLAMRTGFMALGCFPFIFAFGSKSNLVTFVTGHSHEKLQVYHQFISHLFLVLSLLHTFPFVIQGMREVKPGFEPLTQLEWSWHIAHKVYYWSGTALLVILVWLCWFSLPVIRNRSYELFKYLHIVSALLFTAFFFIHCNKLLGSWDYLWATVIIYAVSVVARFGYMFLDNARGMPEAAFEILPAGMVKLRVRFDAQLHWKPGQHYFFHFLSVMPFQSHPFTVASIPRNDHAISQELVILIREASGVTQRLARYLATKDSGKMSLYLDGPFGGIPGDLSIYEHVILFAGGTGVTFVVPLLQDLVCKMNKEGEKSCVCKSVEVVWSVRDEPAVSWMSAELGQAIADAPTGSVNVRVHLTGEDNRDDTASDPEKGNSATPSFPSPSYGRADVKSVIRQASDENRTMGVAVCGPESLVFDVRNGVADVQKDIALGKSGCHEVFLHTEEYSW